jgi:hypothetical protein
VQYPGAIYHVMNRGDRREAIFRDEQDRERFIKTLEETCEKTSWQVLGIPKDSRVGRREFEKAMEARRTEDDPKAWVVRRRGQG